MINSSSFEDLYFKADTAHRELVNFYPSLLPVNPRLATAFRIKAILSSVYLMTIHFDDNLQDLSWWQKKGLDKVFTYSNGHNQELTNYLMFLAWGGLITYPFSHFEAGIRQIVREIYPNEYSKGTAHFESIYKSLFSKLKHKGWMFSLGEGDPSNFLGLYRQTRNTIHNNGIFYSSKNCDEKYIWRDEEYC